jgi:hypothetical protein
MPSCYGRMEKVNQEIPAKMPSYQDFQMVSRVLYLLKIVNKVQTAENIDVKVHFELQIQLQEFIKNFKMNVIGDQKVMEFAKKIMDEPSVPPVEDGKFEWPQSSYSAGDSLRPKLEKCSYKLKFFEECNFTIVAADNDSYYQERQNNLEFLAKLMEFESMNEILQMFAQKIFTNLSHSYHYTDPEEQDLVVNSSLETLTRLVNTSTSCKLFSNTELMKSLICQNSMKLQILQSPTQQK